MIKNINRMIIVLILLGILLLSLFLLRSVLLPQMGKKAEGERLERIQNSQNYNKHVFENPIKTEMDPPPFEAFKQMMKKGEDRVPTVPVQTFPIDTNQYNTTSEDVLITWLGHSTFIVKINGITILTDPVFSKRASLSQLFGPKKFQYTTEYKIEDLPKIDVVLISHDHYDHLDYSVIKKLKNDVDYFIMPLGVGAHLEHWGVDSTKIIELDWWENKLVNNVQFTATPGRHFTGRTISDRFKTLWCGWAIIADETKLYFTGDSGYFEGFKEIGDKLGPFDLSMMECGQYSEFWPTIHMFPEESVKAAIDLKSKAALPMHWGKFKLSMHSWYESPTRFIQKANNENLKVVTPEIGSTYKLNELPQKKWWLN